MGLFSGWQSTVQSAAQTIANLVGQDIVARSISLTQAAASIAVQLVDGARLKLGTGTTDYLTSNGTTTITAAGNFSAANLASTGGSTNVIAGPVQSSYGSYPAFYSSAAGAGFQITGSGGAFGLVNKFAFNTAPTISSGFGTTPSIAANNGSFAFTINVGTGGVATTGVIGLPAATNGWALSIMNLSDNTATVFLTKQTATTTTTATIGNYDAAGAAAAWTASNILSIIAVAY